MGLLAKLRNRVLGLDQTTAADDFDLIANQIPVIDQGVIAQLIALVAGQSAARLFQRVNGIDVPAYLGEIEMTSPTTVAGVTHSSATITGCGKFEMISWIGCLLGATGGATVVRIQDRPRLTTDFYDLAAFNSVPAAQAAADSIQRMHTAITGVPNKIGKNDAPKLTAGTIAGGIWGDEMRVSCEPLATVTAGAVQKVFFFGHKVK
jgi:hypothetical protein